MKTNLILLFLLLLSFASYGQQSAVSDSTSKKLYVGIGFSTVSYHIYHEELNNDDEAAYAYFSPISLNLGYKISERTSLQMGIAYGGSTKHQSWIPGALDTLVLDTNSKTHVFAIPVTVRYTFFKAYKRFPIYGTATVMPALGSTKTIVTETRHGVETTLIDQKNVNVNTYFTAGVGFNYKISKSFDGFFEYHAFKYNLAGKNSVFYDWDQGARGFYRFFRTVGLGVNYNFKQ